MCDQKNSNRPLEWYLALLLTGNTMGILRNHLHKRRATGGKRAPIRNKRKFELARPAAMTKLGAHRIHPVR